MDIRMLMYNILYLHIGITVSAHNTDVQDFSYSSKLNIINILAKNVICNVCYIHILEL